MGFDLALLPGMELSRALALLDDSSEEKAVSIRELVSHKYQGDKTRDSCRVVLAATNREGIVLTVSYF